jgi:hypothetical protein
MRCASLFFGIYPAVAFQAVQCNTQRLIADPKRSEHLIQLAP